MLLSVLSRLIPAGLWQEALRGAAWWIAALPLRDVRRCREQLALAFPGRGAAWRRAQAGRVFAHFGRMAGMTLAAFGRDGAWAARRIAVTQPERVAAVAAELRAGRGLIVFTGHLGNWELLGRGIGHCLPLSVVGRRLRSPRADALVRALRTATGAEQIDQDEDPRRILGALRRGRLVAILNDQDIPRLAGGFVPFFGRPAWTPLAPGALCGSAAGWFTVACVAVGGRWHLRIGPLHRAPRRRGEAAALDVVAEATAEWESLIRAHPAQWAWWHRRWRTTPAERPGAPGLPVDGCPQVSG